VQRILIRSGKNPLDVVSPEATCGYASVGTFGTNVGNVAFSDSVFRLLSVPGVEVVANGYSTERSPLPEHFDRINAEFDAFVVPLANAFRVSFRPRLRDLTRAFRKIKVPVIIVGVGTQMSLEDAGTDGTPSDLDDDVRDFMKAVLDRSAKVGVRGDVTRRYLKRLGFGDEHVEVIGCPGVYLLNTDEPVEKKVPALTPESLVNLTLSPYVHDFRPFFDRAARDYPNAVYIPQRVEDLQLMLWGREFGASKDPAMPVTIDHPLYREGRMLFMCDSLTWLRYAATREYTIGTRIHGSIMSLAAGTPATLVAHDSRTLELAEYHEIPIKKVPDIAETDTVASIYDEADYTAFNRGKGPRFKILTDFLELNGLAHIAQPGKANPKFDKAWRKAAFPPPVTTLAADGVPDVLIRRLDWLYQSSRNDHRQYDGYHSPLPARPDGREPTDPAEVRDFRSLALRVSKLEKQAEPLARRAVKKLLRRD
jgi:hypothetical protein